MSVTVKVVNVNNQEVLAVAYTTINRGDYTFIAGDTDYMLINAVDKLGNVRGSSAEAVVGKENYEHWLRAKVLSDKMPGQFPDGAGGKSLDKVLEIRMRTEFEKVLKAFNEIYEK